MLDVLEKRPADILNMSQKEILRVTYLGRSQNVNFEALVQMHFRYIIFNFIPPDVCLKH